MSDTAQIQPTYLTSKRLPSFADWRFYVRTDETPANRWFWALVEGGPGDGGVRPLALNWADSDTFNDVDDGPDVAYSSVIGWSDDKAAVEAAWLAYLVSEGWADDEAEARTMAVA